jgi:anaerobic magnesium-protoporphyrin IX monomethyl ester cyclase
VTTDFKIVLIRGGTVGPLGSVNNEPAPPLGLAYVASFLRDNGFPNVQIIDAVAMAMNTIEVSSCNRFQISGAPIAHIVKAIPFDTTLVGFSVMFTHEWIYVRELISSVASLRPDVTIVVGGEHASALPVVCFRECPQIDYIVRGEGEETMLELCSCISRGVSPFLLNGLAYRAKDGEVTINPPRIRQRDLSVFKPPAWDLVPITTYLDAKVSHGAGFGRDIPIMASRGCPYQCTFCSNPAMWTTRYYLRDVDEVLDEIQGYVDTYSVTSVQFADLTAIVKPQWITEFSEKFKVRFPGLYWTLPSGTRSEALTGPILNLLADSGLKYLVYAPESGSTETLKRIKKKIKLNNMVSSIKFALRCGIPVRANFIIGLPGEKRTELYKTIRFAFYLSYLGVDETPLFPYQPYPGTELFEHLMVKNQLSVDDDYYLNLISLSTGNLRIPRASYNEYMSRYELYVYRIFSLIGTYAISYLFHPRKIVRLVRTLRTDTSNTVFEARMKTMMKKFSSF